MGVPHEEQNIKLKFILLLYLFNIYEECNILKVFEKCNDIFLRVTIFSNFRYASDISLTISN